MDLLSNYRAVRCHTEDICKPLQTEDYVVQPVVDVSPPKWHIGHTTWFFETFILKEYAEGYLEFDPNYNYVFNSYYETIGNRVIRTNRGNLSRPTVEDVYLYRKYVDEAMILFLQQPVDDKVKEILTLGINHEQQHQELLFTDIKYILGHNPLFPVYKIDADESPSDPKPGMEFIKIDKGIYEIGYQGDDFCFDNELKRHPVYTGEFSIANRLVTNGEYLQFVDSGGYSDFNLWHADGWDWVQKNQAKSPMYWHLIGAQWMHYTLGGLVPLDINATLNHINYYEAAAFAAWKKMRLPTEFEWEIASGKFDWGERWEWTGSAYLPYPGFSKAPGAIGEYNGKFMVNQMVLRGSSELTSSGHSRNTYRNFFPPQLQWQYSGIRLAY